MPQLCATRVVLAFWPPTAGSAAQSTAHHRPAGIAGAVLLPVTGVAVGAAQLVRGAVNTPEALKQASQGKHWDEVGCWSIERPGRSLPGLHVRRRKHRWHLAQLTRLSRSSVTHRVALRCCAAAATCLTHCLPACLPPAGVAHLDRASRPGPHPGRRRAAPGGARERWG